MTFGYATATGLSKMLDGGISHDAISRFLSKRDYTSKDLWKQVKGMVREVEREDGVLIIDDTVQEKPHMDENDLISWHYDPCQGRSVKGINLLIGLYHADGVSIPVAFELVHKSIRYCEVDTRQEKRRSEVTKNEQMRSMVDACVQNPLKFSWVPADIWFASTQNMEHIKQTRHKDFIMALKSNRRMALSEADGKQKWREITTTYQKRWNVEVFHKSLKSNAALAKSPAHTARTQANHLFASIVTVFKMECLTLRKNINHFALKSKLYIKAIRTAFDKLQAFRAAA